MKSSVVPSPTEKLDGMLWSTCRFTEQEKDQEDQIGEDRKTVTAGGDDEFATGARDWDADILAVRNSCSCDCWCL